MTDPNKTHDEAPRGIVGWFARNSVAANLLMIVALLGGVFGYLQLNREVFPTIAVNGATVSVAWPGASPQEVEEQLIVRIEEALADLDGVDTITSTAREGNGFINVEGLPSVDVGEFIDNIKLEVDSVNNLPQSAYRPVVNPWRSQDQVIGFAVHGFIDRRDLQQIAREIRDEVAQLPGSSLVNNWAILGEEVGIEVSEDNLQRYNLSFDEIVGAIRASSLNASAGSVRTELGELSLTSRQLADTREEFENIIIRQTSDGGTLRVSDVANVSDGFVDANLAATFNGEPMSLIVVLTTPDIDVVDVSASVRAYIEEKQLELPDGVTLSLWWDNSEMYEARMATILNSALFGGLLVLIVLFLFLRPIVAFWVTVGIFVAFGGAFMLLPLLGVTLNMLSLFAFLLVIGIVVDDAIVVGENIHDRVERGETGLTASIVGTQMVIKPVIFAVITTIMMFLPFMLLTGPMVQFTKQISLVVIAALAFSLIESMLILPAHLAHMKPQKTTGFFGPLIRLQRAIAESMVWFARSIYRPAIKFAIRNRYATLIAFIGIFAISIVLMMTNRVGSVFMPQIENETIQVNIQLAEGAPWTRTERVREQLDSAQDQALHYYREQFPGQVDMIESRSTLATDGRIRAWITLADPEFRPGLLPTSEVALKIREFLGPIPDAEEVTLDSTMNDGGSSVTFAISHQDLDVLRAAADDLKTQLRSYDTLYDVVDSLQTSTEELQFTMRPDARALGLTLSDVTRQVRQAFYGEEAQRLPRDGQDVRVMVRLEQGARRSLDTLRDLRIRTSEGREVPLSAVADVSFAPGLNRINRRNGMRTVTVNAELSDPSARGDITQSLAAEFWEGWEHRFPGISRDEIGQSEGEREFTQELLSLFGAALVAMYILLAVAFRSYAQPILIMVAIPFALTGAIFGHLMFDMPIALFSYFGVGAAAGVVINDNLVLMDFVNRLRANGVGAFQALVDSGVQRFRPILLTSVTTFLGILPMIAARSTQAQFLKPMVVALGFAVIFALFLTLLLIPSMYAIGVDISRFFRGLWSGKALPPLGTDYVDTDFAHGEMAGHLDHSPAE
ncbi:efflux RND transporter permease subunit [Maricaulis salignorans]|uniref:Multidrug efflux pump subunit AcrB n=2 Tax=Maricaulis salignorans TaxID=144026 RepID=A0A1G9WWI0_9PROT|nr:efflux RND transporter permease subunit [Maricaulis salignorans]SDM88463.1 Multidrug efflux pump subunit AcrB [Maricaulis salignorans]